MSVATILTIVEFLVETGALGALAGILLGKTKWGQLVVAGLKGWAKKSSKEELEDALEEQQRNFNKKIDELKDDIVKRQNEDT